MRQPNSVSQVKPMNKARTAVQLAVNAFVDKGDYKAVDLQLLEDTIAEKIKSIKAAHANAAPKAAAFMPRTARPSAGRASRQSSARSRKSAQDDNPMLQKIMSSGLHAKTDNSIYGAWSDVKPLIPKRKTVAPKDLVQQDWVLVNQYQELENQRRMQEKQRKELEKQQKLSATLQEQMKLAEEERKKAELEKRRWREQVDVSCWTCTYEQ